ncbi:hypothetical protein GOBAR_AA00352 [Gossypium barbadense]|uniref:RRM domain-containing protein n=1 Tax=Gossypium barbadense TaxID=3634 RepID=A0A2P5YX94_GOSBA|nr:hypothetical protein GOBAR_AA00352 [Gossypium barbadense]
MEGDDVVMAAPESTEADLDDMKRRLKEMEDEAAALREMQAKVEKEMGSVQDPASAATSQANREEVDSRSIFVGNNVMDFSSLPVLVKMNFTLVWSCKDDVAVIWHWPGRLAFLNKVDYSCTPEEVQQHFQSCGTVNRVTIRTDKYGQPKGYAYVEFLEAEAVQEALLLNESELHGRQLKVTAKRTNIPGMKQYRPRRSNPFMQPRDPFMAPYFFSPYGYGFSNLNEVKLYPLCVAGRFQG